MDETLHGMATRLLELVQQTFLADQNPLPARQVVYMSPIPADCEQVAVLFSGWLTFPEGEGPVQCRNMRWLADLSIIVTRCTPALPKTSGTKTTAPTPEKMSNAALIASNDAESLLHVLHSLEEAGGVGLVVQAPSGGLQTVELSLQVPIGRL